MGSERVEVEVQFNGKPVGRVSVPKSATQNELEHAAMALPEIQRLVGENTVRGIVTAEGNRVNVLV